MLLLLLLLAFADPQGGRAARPVRPAAPAAPKFFVSTLPVAEVKDKQAVLDTSAGTIVMDLLADAAPNHVGYFITKARQGAYNGTTFHRVIPRAIVQGGDPLSKDPAQTARYGTGGLGELKFEANAEKMTRGAVAAVLRPGDRDSGGAQFFICVSDQPTLDGQYTVWARVVEGINVAQAISLTVAADTTPRDRIVINSVTIRAKVPPPPEPFVSDTVEQLARQRAIIETSLGQITLEFLPEKAPSHVRQFLRLAISGVYDGTAFHRIAKGFVIQGGYLPTRSAPLDERQESYIRPLQPEFNDTLHDRGVVSMARGDDPASATSSFFIVLARTQALDRQYTAFARVVDGFDVIEKIEAASVTGETPDTRIDVRRVTVQPQP